MNTSLAKGIKYLAPEAIRDSIFLSPDYELFADEDLKDNYIFEEYAQGLVLRGIGGGVTFLTRDKLKFKILAGKANDVTSLGEVSAVNKSAKELLEAAKTLEASDIHIIVIKEDLKTLIRFRVLGDLEDYKILDDTQGEALCRMYAGVMSNSTAKGQDSFSPENAISVSISRRKYLPEGVHGVRLENVPTATGNKMTCRLLFDTNTGDQSLVSLGFAEQQHGNFKKFERSSYGMILFSGPTGSGKSTSMHRYLIGYNALHKGTRAIFTIEDPVELPISFAVQTEIPFSNTPEERSREFVKLLSSSKRSDPDAIMVGEIRDAPSAKLSIEAAMTGHQVVGTVHANNVLGSLQRLVDLGADRTLVYDHHNVIGLIAQRLIRELCSNCKIPFLSKRLESTTPTQDDFERMMSSSIDTEKAFCNGGGCNTCSGRGVSGRTVVSQVIKTDPKLMQLMRDDNIIGALDYIENEMKSVGMVEHAISKVNAGLVDPFDAEAVLGELNVSTNRG